MKRNHNGDVIEDNDNYSSKQVVLLELINLKRKEENILKKLKITNKYNDYIDTSYNYIKILKEKHDKLNQKLNQVFENVDLMTYIFSFIDHTDINCNRIIDNPYCCFSLTWKTAVLNNIKILRYGIFYIDSSDSDDNDPEDITKHSDSIITTKDAVFHNTILHKLEILWIQNINMLEKIMNLKITFPILKILFIEDLEYYVKKDKSTRKFPTNNVKGRKIYNNFIKKYPTIKIYIFYNNIEDDVKQVKANMKNTKTYKMEKYEKTHSITAIDLYDKIMK
jgi:hypothetical protein